MKQMIATAKDYTVVILKAGLKRSRPDLQQIIWEHGRRNFALREEGILSIVCPIFDNSDIMGIAIFNSDIARTKKILDEDPAVMEEVLVYEIHATKSFPGDSLP